MMLCEQRTSVLTDPRVSPDKLSYRERTDLEASVVDGGQYRIGWESRFRMKLLGDCANFSVLENHAFALAPSLDCNVCHGLCQVVGANGLVREEHPKRWINRAQQPV